MKMKTTDLPLSLTKENFWNEMYEKYPDAMKTFCAWIDEYKERVKWDSLFYNESDDFYEYAVKGRRIKYHDLPIAMQIGIFLQFVSEVNTFEEDGKTLSDMVASIERFLAKGRLDETTIEKLLKKDKLI